MTTQSVQSGKDEKPVVMREICKVKPITNISLKPGGHVICCEEDNHIGEKCKKCNQLFTSSRKFYFHLQTFPEYLNCVFYYFFMNTLKKLTSNTLIFLFHVLGRRVCESIVRTTVPCREYS